MPNHVKSLEELIIDGNNVGPVVAYVAANPAKAEEITQLLYDWRDAFLVGKAEELQVLETKNTELETLKTNMTTKVVEVLESGDPEQFRALAEEFLTPEQEKARLADLAAYEALKAKLGIK